MSKILIAVVRFLSWLIVLGAYYMATWSLAQLIVAQTIENLVRLAFWAILASGVLVLLFVNRRLDVKSWRLPVLIVIALVVAVLNLVVVLGSSQPPTKGEPGAPPPVSNPSDTNQLSDTSRDITNEEVIVAVNQERVAAGLEPLAVNPLLSVSSCLKVDDMIQKNYWGHDSPEGVEPWYWIKLAGYPYISAGENLAYGYATADAMVAGWMNSQTHRDNILNARYTETGVCVKRADRFQGAMDQFVSVQHFGTR